MIGHELSRVVVIRRCFEDLIVSGIGASPDPLSPMVDRSPTGNSEEQSAEIAIVSFERSQRPGGIDPCLCCQVLSVVAAESLQEPDEGAVMGTVERREGPLSTVTSGGEDTVAFLRVIHEARFSRTCR